MDFRLIYSAFFTCYYRAFARKCKRKIKKIVENIQEIAKIALKIHILQNKEKILPFIIKNGIFWHNRTGYAETICLTELLPESIMVVVKYRKFRGKDKE